ncbi:MAG: transposase [Nitrospirae bacterium]|nr:transposase [Nitrospirota bacterium]MBF0535735.1 transposase [Nitrospirota bacterium]MBF0617560.1 transposase [Nitrospirota bacterium]
MFSTNNLSNYFKYLQEIRNLIYTTNAIEGFHRQIRKVTKTKGAFSCETALLKLLYMAVQNLPRGDTPAQKNGTSL